MQRKTLHILLLILVLTGNSLSAQFNTLTPTLPKKTENISHAEKTQNEVKPTEKKDKKSWKEIFNITTKSDLKNDIDSLKTLLKLNGKVNEQRNSDFKKIKDSLLFEYQKFQNKPSQEKAPFGGLGAYSPLKNITITSSFGARIHPIFGITKMHNGIDLKAHYEDVHAVLDGIVTEVGWDSKGGGKYIKINHFNRFESAYLHLSEMYYKVGEKVRAGFIIAKSGNTGNSTGPHLHFAVKEFGKIINPAHFLNDLNNANHLIATYYANRTFTDRRP